MTRAFLVDAAERVVWTAVQAFAAALLASPVFDNLGLDWQDGLKIAGFAAIASAAKSILALKVGEDNTAQLGADTYRNREEDGHTDVDRQGTRKAG